MTSKSALVKRGRGRPRTRPEGVKPRRWYATDAEFVALQRTAAKEGITAEQLVRRRVLGKL